MSRMQLPMAWVAFGSSTYVVGVAKDVDSPACRKVGRNKAQRLSNISNTQSQILHSHLQYRQSNAYRL
ncbi:hypothetical protein L1987_23681 [Smallanthus sonchifolius]|uniref:Uncharacterized protein n=1 Tax=Smallanthus sonchifolius TaxID=185202 RepID=A0ACB9IKY6_9ASTR|nr:hypothetical protein L1987_23681 [Smallanthus sonchifolius]